MNRNKSHRRILSIIFYLAVVFTLIALPTNVERVKAEEENAITELRIRVDMPTYGTDVLTSLKTLNKATYENCDAVELYTSSGYYAPYKMVNGQWESIFGDTYSGKYETYYEPILGEGRYKHKVTLNIKDSVENVYFDPSVKVYINDVLATVETTSTKKKINVLYEFDVEKDPDYAFDFMDLKSYDVSNLFTNTTIRNCKLQAYGGSGNYTFRKESNDCSWLTVSANGMISGTPTKKDTETHTIKVSCSDGNDTQYVYFTVAPVNYSIADRSKVELIEVGIGEPYYGDEIDIKDILNNYLVFGEDYYDTNVNMSYVEKKIDGEWQRVDSSSSKYYQVRYDEGEYRFCIYFNFSYDYRYDYVYSDRTIVNYMGEQIDFMVPLSNGTYGYSYYYFTMEYAEYPLVFSDKDSYDYTSGKLFVGNAIEQKQLVAARGTGNYVFSKVSTDCSWLKVSSEGVISGTPDVADSASHTITIKCSDGKNEKTIDILVGAVYPNLNQRAKLTKADFTGFKIPTYGDQIDLYAIEQQIVKPENAPYDITSSYIAFEKYVDGDWHFITYRGSSHDAYYQISFNEGKYRLVLNLRIDGDNYYMYTFDDNIKTSMNGETGVVKSRHTSDGEEYEEISACFEFEIEKVSAPLTFKQESFYDYESLVVGEEIDEKTLTAIGGTGNYTFEKVTSGYDWFIVSADGKMSGKPTEPTKEKIEIVVQCSDGNESKTITIHIDKIYGNPSRREPVSTMAFSGVKTPECGDSMEMSLVSNVTTPGIAPYHFSEFYSVEKLINGSWVRVNRQNGNAANDYLVKFNSGKYRLHLEIRVDDYDGSLYFIDQSCTVRINGKECETDSYTLSDSYSKVLVYYYFNVENTDIPFAFPDDDSYDYEGPLYKGHVITEKQLIAFGGTEQYTFTKVTNECDWLLVSEDGKITGKPTEVDTREHTIKISCTDGISTKSIAIKVAPVKMAPQDRIVVNTVTFTGLKKPTCNTAYDAEILLNGSTAENDKNCNMKVVIRKIQVRKNGEWVDVAGDMSKYKVGTYQALIDVTIDGATAESYKFDPNVACTINGKKAEKDGYVQTTDTASTFVVTYVFSVTHNFVSEIEPATLKENGKKKETCKSCGLEKDVETIYYAKTIKLSKTKYVYNGTTQTPSVVVKDSKGNVIGSSNYKVTKSKGRKLVGKYNIRVTFNGVNYKGKKVMSYTIVPQTTKIKSVSSAPGSFTVTWNRISSQVMGYQIQYSTNSDFKSSKTDTVKDAKQTSKKITGLSAKKKYYVRIRTYKKVDGKNYYSAWSNKKSVTTK